MSKFPIKSVLEQIAENVFTMKCPNQAKQFITEFINGKDINEKDKYLIISNVNACKNMYKIQSYICNALLKYEGMGVNNMNKTAKQAAAETALV